MAVRLARCVRGAVDRSAFRRPFASAAPDEPAFVESKPENAAKIDQGDIGKTSGIPENQLNRKIVIYSPSRSASQQGRCHLGKWKFNFESTEKYENPLMGWTGTTDPYAYVGDAALSFDTKEAAIEFARKQGWDYTVREPHQQTVKPKAYADNFKWKGTPVMSDE